MAADKVTFTNTKVNETISSEQRYQSHINSDGSVSLEQIASEVAGNLKDNANYVLNLLREVAEVTRRHLAAGERVLHDGLCRFELEGTGCFDSVLQTTPEGTPLSEAMANASANLTAALSRRLQSNIDIHAQI